MYELCVLDGISGRDRAKTGILSDRHGTASQDPGVETALARVELYGDAREVPVAKGISDILAGSGVGGYLQLYLVAQREAGTRFQIP